MEQDEGREAREREADVWMRIIEQQEGKGMSGAVRGNVTKKEVEGERDQKDRIKELKETIRRLSEELKQVLKEAEESEGECNREGRRESDGSPKDERNDSKD